MLQSEARAEAEAAEEDATEEEIGVLGNFLVTYLPGVLSSKYTSLDPRRLHITKTSTVGNKLSRYINHSSNHRIIHTHIYHSVGNEARALRTDIHR